METLSFATATLTTESTTVPLGPAIRGLGGEPDDDDIIFLGLPESVAPGSYELRLPAGPDGVVDRHGGALAEAAVVRFEVTR